MRLANGALPWPWIDPDKALPWVEQRIGFALAESQVAAIRLALKSKVLVMTGGPGVGKTTIVKAILRIRRRWSKLQEWLCPGPPRSPQIGIAGVDPLGLWLFFACSKTARTGCQ